MFPSPYLKNCNKWWDGYQGDAAVLIDDFDKAHHVLGHHLKIWGDRYGFIGEVKGGVVKARPKYVVVTSNYHPREIWDDSSTLNPILRRYRIIKFDKAENGEYVQHDEGRVQDHERLDLGPWDRNMVFVDIPEPVPCDVNSSRYDTCSLFDEEVVCSPERKRRRVGAEESLIFED